MNLLKPIDRDLTVKGLRLRVLDWGGSGRPPLLLLHGFTGHAHASRDRKSTRLNSSHVSESRMPSSA